MISFEVLLATPVQNSSTSQEPLSCKYLMTRRNLENEDKPNISKQICCQGFSTPCFASKVMVVRASSFFFYLMDNELMDAIWQSPTIFLHQRNKGVANQFLLSFVFSCQTTTHANES